MAEPPQEAIEQCTLLTGCTEKQAIEFLKRYDNDANRAINAFLDNPNVINLVDRTINTTIDDGLNYERQTAGLSPPARPPSRSQEASSEGDKFTHITEYMSSGDPLGPQESGTISTGAGVIGPATREQYDERTWGVTLFDPTKREVQPEADPERRKREHGQPAFLCASQEAHYLPGFLTILHTIPEVKETLLLKGRVLDDYGSDDQWWNGRAITLPQEVSMDAEQRQYFGILTEVQRLMALLEGTNRAYGSADQLADLASTSCSSPKETLDKFMTLWQEAVTTTEGGANVSKLFQSFCMKVSRSSTGIEERGSGEPFRLIDAYCYPDRQEDIYDALDESIWPDHDKDILEDIWLETVSPVLPIKVSSVLPSVNDVTIKIPFVLYVDRYLPECMEWAKTMRRMRLDVEEERRELEKRISQYEETNGPTIKAVLEKAKTAAELLLEDCWTTGLIEDKSREEQARACHEKVRSLTSTIDSILPQIDEKIATLKSRKAALIESLNKETRKFTTKTDDPETSAQREYTLRGFCTSPHVIYLQRPAMGDLDSSTAYVDPTTREKWQWWRITYPAEEGVSGRSSRTTPPGNTNYAGYSARMSLDEIERLMSNDGRSALFVYVDKKALADLPKGNLTGDTVTDGLPAPLKQFVDQDNAAFEDECRRFQEDLARKKDELNRPYSDMAELKGREMSVDPLHNPQVPPPVPPRPERTLGVLKEEEGGDNLSRGGDKSDDSQTITIEVENEEGKWDKMKFPSSSSSTKPQEKNMVESEQAPSQPQVRAENRSTSSLAEEIHETPEVQHIEEVQQVEETRPNEQSDGTEAPRMSVDSENMAKGG